MSLDVYKLLLGDRIKFAGRLVRQVEAITEDRAVVTFTDGYRLMANDPMWKLAELAGPFIPWLYTARVHSSHYQLIDRFYVSPGHLLRLLKLDVVALEATETKEEKEEE